MKDKLAVFWFRRDLRLQDNAGLFHALQSDYPVLPIFIFDDHILENLERDDARVSFIHKNLQKIREQLLQNDSSIAIFKGKPEKILKQLLKSYDIAEVYTNHDYEPYAKERDSTIEEILSSHNIPFKTYKDQVIFEKEEVVKNDGSPYVVYSPYMRLWKEKFRELKPVVYNTKPHFKNFIKARDLPNLTLKELGFEPSSINVPPFEISETLIKDYDAKRNFPGLDSTSRLGPHLRFGTVSIREIVKIAASQKNETFLQELIWREFFMQILYHFPHTVTHAFKPKYDRIQWRNNEEEFLLWKAGKTGYPLVDAGMRQLNETGFMHNRVRMLVASFLCKHLLIDWRWGEAYFAEKLLDYEMSSNVGNWQWAAGSGVDAAPYFRIFNPSTQLKDYDKDMEYVKAWIKEYGTANYPEPMVDHKEARERVLKVYKAAVTE
ncbi:deoxyribodipyrimidine photo-lyase [Antarcticibacterium arcticum]|uniref:Deoxyribodipyrimidine photo-lyase n=1 Tax=Antarcticibacterium arcticum TaxID=2585771 RepID=A0A5B8YFV0_9FLAO|nr:deoxyribodipyrimidine photo-lyase [Antarcticibacterium arcticum]QED36820.1 deoxyribodipyrimidine photo-lyase [Antarcticibacterium arcticum]